MDQKTKDEIIVNLEAIAEDLEIYKKNIEQIVRRLKRKKTTK
jgi:hypothetical protein